MNAHARVTRVPFPATHHQHALSIPNANILCACRRRRVGRGLTHNVNISYTKLSGGDFAVSRVYEYSISQDYRTYHYRRIRAPLRLRTRYLDHTEPSGGRLYSRQTKPERCRFA